jgi:hypothetical protein
MADALAKPCDLPDLPHSYRRTRQTEEEADVAARAATLTRS